MTAKERNRLKELERKVHDLEAHQLHLSPYTCPYCKPWPYVPYHPWPRITTTWIGNVAPSETFDMATVNPTVTSGYIESNV